MDAEQTEQALIERARELLAASEDEEREWDELDPVARVIWLNKADEGLKDEGVF